MIKRYREVLNSGGDLAVDLRKVNAIQKHRKHKNSNIEVTVLCLPTREIWVDAKFEEVVADFTMANTPVTL